MCMAEILYNGGLPGTPSQRDLTLAASNPPRWEYLHHGDWQTLQGEAFSPAESWSLGIYWS